MPKIVRNFVEILGIASVAENGPFRRLSWKAATKSGSNSGTKQARDERGGAIPTMGDSPPRLGFELAPLHTVGGCPRLPEKERKSRVIRHPRKRQFAVSNLEEELAKRRNITGKRLDGYIGRENGASPAAIRVRNRASPSSGTLPIIFGNVAKIMCNSSVPIMSICGI